MEDEVDGTGMVFNKEPVAYVFSLTIYRQRLAMADIVDKQRYELFRELVRTIIVGAVSHDGRHAVSVVICPYEMVRTSLGSRIGRVWIVLRRLKEKVFSIGFVMFRRPCLGGERRLDAFRMCHG